MGQKVQPNGFRLGVIRDWNAKWYAKGRDYARKLTIDQKVRDHVLKSLKNAAISKVQLDRFGDNLNVEGWGSFVDQLLLDKGWADNQPLYRLAHLRKRMENAVRAYASVMVHCRGWKQDELSEFAVEKGLMPPQFTENLWHRVIASPLQLTSYFLGFRDFNALYKAEQKRLGTNFSTKAFCDKVLKAGPVPAKTLQAEFHGEATRFE